MNSFRIDLGKSSRSMRTHEIIQKCFAYSLVLSFFGPTGRRTPARDLAKYKYVIILLVDVCRRYSVEIELRWRKKRQHTKTMCILNYQKKFNNVQDGNEYPKLACP